MFELLWEKVARQTSILLFISFFFFLYHTKIDSIVEARVLSKNIDSQNSYVVGNTSRYRFLVRSSNISDESAVRLWKIT